MNGKRDVWLFCRLSMSTLPREVDSSQRELLLLLQGEEGLVFQPAILPGAGSSSPGDQRYQWNGVCLRSGKGRGPFPCWTVGLWGRGSKALYCPPLPLPKGIRRALGPVLTTLLYLAGASLSLGHLARGTCFSLPASTELVVGSALRARSQEAKEEGCGCSKDIEKWPQNSISHQWSFLSASEPRTWLGFSKPTDLSRPLCPS